MRIAFDIGGVISKYPDVFRALIEALVSSKNIEVFIISDMHPVAKIEDMLMRNGYSPLHHSMSVHSADYKAHGELCKAVLCAELGIDLLIDDFPGYVCLPGKPMVRLLVMPDPRLPYYADLWQTDGSEGDFGRRNPPGSKNPPEDRGKKTSGGAP